METIIFDTSDFNEKLQNLAKKLSDKYDLRCQIKVNNMQLQQKEILTLNEACEYLGYKKSYFYKLTSENILPFSKPHRGKMYFNRKKLDAWMLGSPNVTKEESEAKAANCEKTREGVRG